MLDQYKTPATGIGGKFELRLSVDDAHTLRLGTDWRRSSGAMNEIAISAFSGKVTERRQAGRVNSDLGLFAEDDRRLGALTLTGGMRTDRTVISGGYYATRDAQGTPTGRSDYAKHADWTVTWRGGAWRALSEALAVRGAAYSGLRMPTLNELYRPFVVFPVITQANAQLRSERLEGYEAGLDLTPMSGVKFTLAAFENRVKHAIANVTLEPNLRQRQTRISSLADPEVRRFGHTRTGAGRGVAPRGDAAPCRRAVRGRPGKRCAACRHHARPLRASSTWSEGQPGAARQERDRRNHRDALPGRVYGSGCAPHAVGGAAMGM
ncbi:TonB-dependent receptor plug domain-containing protein [Novosphingobium sp. BW1]|uniref:TonB-dependent receptor plug domain-containing protein n=1 Tax=Novosphingobium sp. BW1 TaxID=2592621 RepID=UPI00352E3B9C